MEVQIGKTIQRARHELRLTQKALADRADVSVRWLSKVENGRGGAPGMDYVGRIAGALGLGVEDLVRGDVAKLSGAAAGPAGRLRRSPRAHVERRTTQWGTVIGGMWFPWVVVSYGPYRADHIESFFDPGEPAYPSEVDQAVFDLPDAGAYGLARFHVSARVGEREEPKLALHFRPISVRRALATDERLDVPLTAGGRTFTLRERYAADADLRSEPVPELATRWGVGLSVVTADGMLLVPAIAAGALRAFDAGPSGAPDHFAIARRAALGELGLELLPGELTWLSFGAESYRCAYSLVGRVDTPLTVAELAARRLEAVKFSPSAVARFCANPAHSFSALALIAIVHTLMHEFGVERTEAAFQGMSVELTQHLPQWLVLERTE